MEEKDEKREEEKKAHELKKEDERQNNILKWVLVIGVIVIILVAVYYLYAQTQIHSDYKGITFEAVKMGDLIFYETRTLANSSTDEPFGFRIRTSPSELANIPFDNLEDFRLMKVNGYTYSGGAFNCEGYGMIAMENLKRLFFEMGTVAVRDDNSTCDPEGKYNYFTLKYGNETAIREVGNSCYDIVIKGNDDQCEILPATEKLMVEMYVRYLDIQN